MRRKTRQCPRCGEVRPLEDRTCGACGTPLVRKRFAMTRERIAQVHMLSARKGLDREFYELNLQAVGAKSCKDFNQRQFNDFISRLRRLPDMPGRKF